MADIWFKVHQSAFRQIFNMAMNAVQVRNTIPLLAHMLFRVEDGTLHIRASDLDLQVDAQCEALDVSENASFCLPADRLKALMGSLPDKGEISFGPGRFNDQVSISSGRSKISIPFLPGADFPSISVGALAGWFDVNGSELSKALANVAFALNKNDDRPYLTGPCLHVDEIDGSECLTVAATDGIGLARVRCTGTVKPVLPQRQHSNRHVIVPAKGADSIRKLFEDAQAGCSMAATDTLICAVRNGVMITSKLIEGTYPDYKRVIPAESETMMEVETASLTAAIKRVCVVVDDKKHDAIRISVRSGGVRLDLIGETGGIAVEDLACDVTADAGFEIGVNGDQLQKLMGSVSTPRVRIHFGEHATPLRIAPVGADEQVYVLVPMAFRNAPERNDP